MLSNIDGPGWPFPGQRFSARRGSRPEQWKTEKFTEGFQNLQEEEKLSVGFEAEYGL